jgi:hypothetical protein
LHTFLSRIKTIQKRKTSFPGVFFT